MRGHLSMRGWLRVNGLDRGGLVALVALATYVWLAPSHIVAADDAEFATLGAIGGHAHPSGFPAIVLWLRTWSWLPVGSPAHRAAVATAIAAGLVVVVLHAACRAWGARPLAASLTCAIVAAAPIVLRVHIESDVFAENSLIGALVLWFAAPAPPLRGRRRAFALGVIAGLGIAGNLTCVLLAPLGLYGVACAVAESDDKAGALGLALLGLVGGLAPYAYLFVAPGPGSWAPVDSLGSLLDTVLRRDYGSVTNLPGGAHVSLVTSLVGHAELVGRSWLWLPAVAGLAAMVTRAWRGDARHAWRVLAASWLLSGPVFATRIGIDPSGVGAYLAARLQILSIVVLSVPVAVALEAALARARRPAGLAVGTVVATGIFIALVATSLPRLDRVHSRAVELGSRNLLVSLPLDAVVVVLSEDQCFGIRYLQLAEGERRDVTLVCWALAVRDWYCARLATQGLVVTPSDGSPAPVDEVEAWIGTGRPVFVDGFQRPALHALPNYPFGVVYRVLPHDSAIPTMRETLDRQRAVFATYALDYPRPESGDDFAAVANERYAHAWLLLARSLDRAGDREGAATAAAVAEQLAPD